MEAIVTFVQEQFVYWGTETLQSCIILPLMTSGIFLSGIPFFWFIALLSYFSKAWAYPLKIIKKNLIENELL
jgi:hypothetical protein